MFAPPKKFTNGWRGRSRVSTPNLVQSNLWHQTTPVSILLATCVQTSDLTTRLLAQKLLTQLRKNLLA